MSEPRRLTDHDRDNLLTAPNWTIHHGKVRLTASKASDGHDRRFILNGPTGTHTLLVSATDSERRPRRAGGACRIHRDHFRKRLRLVRVGRPCRSHRLTLPSPPERPAGSRQ